MEEREVVGGWRAQGGRFVVVEERLWTTVWVYFMLFEARMSVGRLFEP